jgi:hypothetical protein
MKKVIFCVVLIVGLFSYRLAANEIDLSGKWVFALDPNDIGVGEQWYSKPLENKLNLPGSLQEQGFGNDVGVDTRWTSAHSWYLEPWIKSSESEPYRQAGNFKIPFWLQPDKHYIGAAWYIVKGSVPLVMNDFPESYRPIVYIIDDWFKANRFGLLFEAKVGKGKLMVCGANLYSDLDKRPAARQFRRSIEQYMASDKFNPKEEIDMALIKEWLKY